MRKYDPYWLKKLAEKAFTSDEILAKIRNDLTPKEQLEFIARFAPKEIKMEADTQIRLIINGLERNKALQVAPTKALIEHEQNDL